MRHSAMPSSFPDLARGQEIRTIPAPLLRPGLTLMEVLVSIFIMAIGMLALLTLFPLGALRMDQAIKDERCAQAGVQAIELAKVLDLANDPTVRNYLLDPNAPPGAQPGTVSTIPGPSKAVFVDPFGAAPVLDSTTGNVVRVTQFGAWPFPNQSLPNTYYSTSPQNYEFFSLTDDIVFQIGTGAPRPFGTQIGRETRFSWAYLLQQPQVQSPSVTNYSVCIYNRRPLAAPALEFTLPNATLNIPNNTISYVVTDPSTAKPILPGQWVLDATMVKGVPASSAGGGATTLTPLANFYRIVNVRAGTTAGETVLELQTPLRGYPSGTSTYTATGANAPALVIQDSLVEVIDVGPLR